MITPINQQTYKNLNILLSFEDEFTLHRISKLLSSQNKVTKCCRSEDFQDCLETNTFDIVIAGPNLQTEKTIDLIKLYRFCYAEDASTKFYLFSLDQEIDADDLLDAKIDGLISPWDLVEALKVA